MKQKFRDIRLSAANKERLDQINDIIEEYKAGGYVLTLRQLYYQLVSRDIIPNQQKEYSKLSIVLKEGRMAGIVDWGAIEDRLRVPYTPGSWDSPEDIIDTVISQYKKPRMEGQSIYIETWVEKDALSGVLKRVTSKYHVPILVNRGYSSVTAMKDAFDRFIEHLAVGKECHILYLGDFDPSGQDMIRDIRERICEFILGYYTTYPSAEKYTRAVLNFHVHAIALTKEQIKEYDPPPNPAKLTDTRAKKYVAAHGNESWEVDALKPEVLHQLLENNITSRIDINKYTKVLIQEKMDKEALKELKKHL